MNKSEARRRIDELGIVACARVDLLKHIAFACETLYSAGIPVVEIALTSLEAEDAIADLANRFPDMVVGAGTVLDADSARRCVDAGARFLTSPGLVPEVVAYAKSADVTVLPGALTPTEIIAAWKGGADFVKIFPTSSVGGPNYIRALKVPLPQIPLIVTGGVNQSTAFDFILAGASAIGLGAELLPKEAILYRQGKRIHELARRFLNAVKEARAQLESRQGVFSIACSEPEPSLQVYSAG
ncbi:MAG: bifunctional 4-hydroxy-2-oxoglutarate aldolase/2-dehydro-3-deoxy-phosphogluconate aldolase [Terracidiphilus sp.]